MVKVLILILFSINIHASPIEIFKSTEISSPNFIKHSFNAAKEYLTKKQFERTLAISQFYRTNFLNKKESYSVFFEESFYQLEIFTLLQICQWEHAKELLNEYKNIIKSLKKDETKLNQTIKQLKYSRLVQAATTKNINDLNKVSFKDYTLFKIPIENIDRVKHPKDLFLKVKNECSIRY